MANEVEGGIAEIPVEAFLNNFVPPQDGLDDSEVVREIVDQIDFPEILKDKNAKESARYIPLVRRFLFTTFEAL